MSKGEYAERLPAFQLGRFKKNLHADFNIPFAVDLRMLLYCQDGESEEMRALRHSLHGLDGLDARHPSFSLTRFGNCIQIDLNETLAGELLEFLDREQGNLLAIGSTLPTYLYAFRHRLDQKLNDGWDRMLIEEWKVI